MPVHSLGVYRRVLELGGSPANACRLSALSQHKCDQLHDHLLREQLLAQVRYDAKARQLQGFGIYPPHVLGPRP